jgi:CubicO group peptidase (beta-lactamase class C family)
MRSAEPSFDPAGTFVGSSYVHATARDFARFGLFALRDGVWEGRRLLPEGWIDHGRTPRSPDEHFVHGAHWWARPDGRWGHFEARGFEGQRISMIPDLDLVLVRLGKTHTDHSPTMDAHLDRIVEQFAA